MSHNLQPVTKAQLKGRASTLAFIKDGAVNPFIELGMGFDTFMSRFTDQGITPPGWKRVEAKGTIRKQYSCPVNGDGWWWTEAVLLVDGKRVGSIELLDGPTGEL
jgi:hypothetical protein